MTKEQSFESFVFKGQQPQPFRYAGVVPGSVQFRGTTLAGDPGAVVYEENADYAVDYAKGAVTRLEQSRIPDWNGHPLCGIDDFDHRQYDDYSNRAYTVYASYRYETDGNEGPAGPEPAGASLARVMENYRAGRRVRLLVYGDSISAGGEASRPDFMFFNRFADGLRRALPGIELDVVNRAIGGECSRDGVRRLSDGVLAEEPDVVLIGYGMNDHAKGSEGTYNGVPVGEYSDNTQTMIRGIRRTGADIILIAPCEANPLWTFYRPNLSDYVEALHALGQEYRLFVADTNRLWKAELAAGKSAESLLLNNINHPNDYGHWLYFKAFQPILQNYCREGALECPI